MTITERITAAILRMPESHGNTQVDVDDSSLGELAEIGVFFGKLGMNWRATPFKRGSYKLRISWTPEQWRRLNETMGGE